MEFKAADEAPKKNCGPLPESLLDPDRILADIQACGVGGYKGRKRTHDLAAAAMSGTTHDVLDLTTPKRVRGGVSSVDSSTEDSGGRGKKEHIVHHSVTIVRPGQISSNPDAQIARDSSDLLKVGALKTVLLAQMALMEETAEKSQLREVPEYAELRKHYEEMLKLESLIATKQVQEIIAK